MMPAITLTGKTSGYILTEGSYYAPKQLWYQVLNYWLLDMRDVLRKLNQVEDFLGISRTRWTNTMGVPSRFAHGIVRIGGDANNLGTMREAVTRLRSEAGVVAWEWHFNPTLDDLDDNFSSHRNVVSNIAILELILAIGRLTGVANASIRRLTMTKTFGLDPLFTIDFGDAHGELENYPVFEFANAWGTTGSFFRLQRAAQFPAYGSSALWARARERVNPGIGSTAREFEQSITDQPIYGSGLSFDGGAAANNAASYANATLSVVIFDLGAAASSALEPLEEAYPDLWEYYGSGPANPGGGALSIGSLDESENDYGRLVASCQHAGPVSALYTDATAANDLYDGAYGVKADGEYDEVSVVYGLDPDEPAEGDPLRPNIYGSTAWPTIYIANLPKMDVLMNAHPSAFWRHNEQYWNAFPEVFDRYPLKEYRKKYVAPPSSAFVPDQITFGTGEWHTSNVDPLEPVTAPDDPEDADAIATAIIERLTGLDGLGPAFDPVTQPAKRYFWAFVDSEFNGGRGRPDITEVGRPHTADVGDDQAMEGVPASIRAAFNEAVIRIDSGSPFLSGLEDDGYYDSFGYATVGAFGGMRFVRQADITLPVDESAGPQRWLVWQSPGTNGHSPLEEAVARY